MRTAIDRGEFGVTEDERFHGAVISAARRALLADFMDHIAWEIAGSRRESLRQPGRPASSLRRHEKVAEAIRVRDSLLTADAMHEHVRSVGDVKLLNWRPDE